LKWIQPRQCLAALRGSFPGVEIEVGGAGDHLPKVDQEFAGSKKIAGPSYMACPSSCCRRRI